jgi:hypothetical protein
MCRIMAFTNFSKIKHENLKSRSEFIGNKLLKTEKDGFGYSMFGEKGIFGERTVMDYFNSHILNKIKPIKDNFVYQDEQNSFGEVSKVTGGAIFHGRVCTNKRGLKNAHPINKHGWSLIHNGVVSHTGEKYEMITDNDSEHVLENFVQGGISQVAQNLTGYYAFAAFDPDGNLHIARDSIANLYVATIPRLESLVFATTRDLIEDFCDKFFYEHSPIQQFTHDTYLIFDKTGKKIHQEDFESRGFTTYEADWSEYSLGRRLTTTDRSFSNTSSSGTTTFGERDYTGYDSSHKKFLAEVKAADETYTFYDSQTSKEIPYLEFKAMSEDDWYTIDVVRPDGTLVDYIDYDKKVSYWR